MAKIIIAKPNAAQIKMGLSIATTLASRKVKHVSPSGVSRDIEAHDAFSSPKQFWRVLEASDVDAELYQTDAAFDTTKAKALWEEYRGMTRHAEKLTMSNGQVVTRIGKRRWRCTKGVVTSVVRSASIESPATKEDALAYVKDVANKNGIKLGK